MSKKKNASTSLSLVGPRWQAIPGPAMSRRYGGKNGFLDEGFSGVGEVGIEGGGEKAEVEVPCNRIRGAIGIVWRDWE